MIGIIDVNNCWDNWTIMFQTNRYIVIIIILMNKGRLAIRLWLWLASCKMKFKCPQPLIGQRTLAVATVNLWVSLNPLPLPLSSGRNERLPSRNGESWHQHGTPDGEILLLLIPKLLVHTRTTDSRERDGRRNPHTGQLWTTGWWSCVWSKRVEEAGTGYDGRFYYVNPKNPFVFVCACFCFGVVM